jgi:hypothetical protein
MVTAVGDASTTETSDPVNASHPTPDSPSWTSEKSSLTPDQTRPEFVSIQLVRLSAARRRSRRADDKLGPAAPLPLMRLKLFAYCVLEPEVDAYACQAEKGKPPQSPTGPVETGEAGVIAAASSRTIGCRPTSDSSRTV